MDITQGLYQPEMNYHDTGFTIQLVETINHIREMSEEADKNNKKQ